MFGLSGIATKLILAGVLLAFLTGGAMYIKHVIQENARMESEIVIKDGVIKSKQNEINSIKENFERQTTALNELNTKNQEANEQINDLYMVLGVNRLAPLMAGKPRLMQKKFNGANSKWLQEMRELTK